MRAIMAIARARGLAVVEDCCQSHLATCDGQPVGSFGVAAAYSFYPTKNLGALGDGGAITTNDAALAAKLKRIRNGGQTDRYHHGEMGVNSRLDEVQAAILSARLPLLAGWTAARRTHAADVPAAARRGRPRAAARMRCRARLPPVPRALAPPRRPAGRAESRRASRRSSTTRCRSRGSRRCRTRRRPSCPEADRVCAQVLVAAAVSRDCRGRRADGRGRRDAPHRVAHAPGARQPHRDRVPPGRADLPSARGGPAAARRARRRRARVLGGDHQRHDHDTHRAGAGRRGPLYLPATPRGRCRAGRRPAARRARGPRLRGHGGAALLDRRCCRRPSSRWALSSTSLRPST